MGTRNLWLLLVAAFCPFTVHRSPFTPPVFAADAAADPPEGGSAGAAADAVKPDAPLDVTITGVAKDEVPIVKTPAPADVPFRDVVSLSREGQTDQVLSALVQYMTPAEQTKLTELDSRQTAAPMMVELPSPPFFRLEAPKPPPPYVWEFQVVDQNNQVVQSQTGNTFSGPFLEWDGYRNSQFKVLVGPAYSPILVVTDGSGKTRRTFGDAVQLDALQYEQDGLLHLEFNNDRLYERDGAVFAREMAPLLAASLHVMRRRVGTPFRVIIYEKADGGVLAQKRLETWKAFLQDWLVLDTDDITLVTMVPKERGRVTAVMMLAEP